MQININMNMKIMDLFMLKTFWSRRNENFKKNFFKKNIKTKKSTDHMNSL